ncbi:LysR family transcriptional regulator [Nocardia sp. NPDC005825]|uniref:LysR family transcriptional regulator n=1 Tax=unclassified Nocardia TaxID=2637762 RepID=UPI0033E29A82
MDHRRLHYLVVVAEEGQLTRAAHRLRMSQSALSKVMQGLENELGTQLFHRTRHGVELTASGVVFLPHAQRALDELNSGREAVRAVLQDGYGTVRVGIADTLGLPAGLDDALVKMRDRHPASVQTVATTPAEVTTMLQDGRLDLALVSVPAEQMPELELEPLDMARLNLLCSADHRLAHRRSVRIADVENESFAELSPESSVRQWVDRLYARTGARRRISFSDLDAFTAIDAVANDLAVTIAPHSPLSERPDLAVIPLRETEAYLVTYLAWHPDARLGTAAEIFRETLRECASRCGRPDHISSSRRSEFDADPVFAHGRGPG